ncbi:MAG: argininosuccinate lyase [bacterium]
MGDLDFISSLSFDKRLAEYDLNGSIAHCRMLMKCGIINKADSDKIISALQAMISDLKKGSLALKGEDIHTAIEKELIKRIGEIGGKLHTARSRNDQVALDTKMYLKETIKRDKKKIKELIIALINTAKKHKDVIMPGFTHLQEAQPVLFSHYILAFGWMFLRDLGRINDCLKRADENPLGACALAGTSFPIDRDATAKILGFTALSMNSIDTVSDRDFLIEYISALAILGVHLSRFAEDFIIWSTTQFGFIELNDKYSSGSSIMPQKRNPDYLELLRAQSGLLTGDLVSILTIMKGTPLSYNRDMQEDKRILFNAVDIVENAVDMTIGFINSLKINKQKMEDACKFGFLEATELADYLAKKEVPFRKSHGIVRSIVEYAVKKRLNLTDIPLKQLKKFSSKFDEDVYNKLSIENIVKSKISKGGTSPAALSIQMKELDRKLKAI